MKRIFLTLLLCLLAVVLSGVCVAYAKPGVDRALAEVAGALPPVPGIDGESPSPTGPGIDGERPYGKEDPSEFPSANPDSGYKPSKDNQSGNGSENNTEKTTYYLYVGIGVGAVVLVVGTVLAVMAIKRKKAVGGCHFH